MSASHLIYWSSYEFSHSSYQQALQAEFSLTEKHKMVELLQSEVKIAGTKRVFTDAVGLYVQSVFKALEEADVSLICFYEK